MSEAASQPFEEALRTLIRSNVRAHARDPQLHHLLSERYGDVGFELDEREPRIALRAVGVEQLAADVAASFDLPRTRAVPVLCVLFTVVEAITHAAILDDVLSMQEEALVEEIASAALGYLDRVT